MKYLLSLLTLVLALNTAAQWQVRDSLLFNPHVTVGYSYQMPGADMAKRFGNAEGIDLGFHIKAKTNWYYGIQYTYFFGTQVTEPGLMQNLYTAKGEILADDGSLAVVYAQERGMAINVNGGKLFPWFGPNKNSGLLITAGVGFLQHKIRLEHQEAKIAQLEGAYLKGYDRLSNGLSLSQYIGYYNLSNNRRWNFYFGFQVIEGFTKCRRDFNFDTQVADTKQRMDILVSPRVGWILNLYQRAPNDFYIY